MQTDITPTFIPPGALNIQNSYWEDADGIVIEAILRHCDIGHNQIVSNCNSMVNITGGCKDMGAAALDQAVRSGKRMMVLIYHGQGYVIMEPGHPTRSCPPCDFKRALEVHVCRQD